MIFTREKTSRLTETGQRDLDGNAIGREWGVSRDFIPTIHGTSFFGLLIVAIYANFSFSAMKTVREKHRFFFSWLAESNSYVVVQTDLRCAFRMSVPDHTVISHCYDQLCFPSKPGFS
jgi:hypothetical protein